MGGAVVVDVLTASCLIVGATLSLSGSLGVLRFPDLLSRMHAATKPQVLGLILVLGAVGLQVPTWGTVSTLMVIGLFQLMTAPVSAHMISRAAYRTKHLRRDLLIRDELADVVAQASERASERAREQESDTTVDGDGPEPPPSEGQER